MISLLRHVAETNDASMQVVGAFLVIVWWQIGDRLTGTEKHFGYEIAWNGLDQFCKMERPVLGAFQISVRGVHGELNDSELLLVLCYCKRVRGLMQEADRQHWLHHIPQSPQIFTLVNR